MDSITVKVPVTIKAKLTEKLKDQLIKEDEAKLENIDLQFKQLEIEENKAAQSIPPEDMRQMQMMRQHFAQQRQQGDAARAQVQEHLETAQKLAIGAEVIQGKTERLVELKVGDDVRDLFAVEVLVEDDKVIAIRS